MSESFIAQTAQDYDLEVHEVERIAKLYPNIIDFYEQLELQIKGRNSIPC